MTWMSVGVEIMTWRCLEEKFFFSLSFEFGINIKKNMLIILFYFGTKILLFHSTRVLSTYSQFIHVLYWIPFNDSA